MNFACERCAKRYALDDAKVPTRGFRVTCQQCGHVFVVGPVATPQPVPRALPPPLPRRTVVVPALATAPVPAPFTAPTPAPAPAEEHDQFFTSPLEPHSPATTQELVLSLKRRNPNRLPAIAVGAVVVAGLVVGGAWWAGLLGGGDPTTSPEALAGRLDRQPGAPPLSTRAAPIEPSVSPPEAPLQAPPQPARIGPSTPAGGQARGGPATSAQDRRGRIGAPIGKRDKRLLDLLGRKQDASGVSAPAAEELSTGRASLQEATVRGALSANSSAFSACIGKAAKADPGFRLGRNTLVMELVVQPSGVVSRATMQDPRYAQTALGHCLVGAARRMIFPSFEGEQILVQAPLKLSAVQ